MFEPHQFNNFFQKQAIKLTNALGKAFGSTLGSTLDKSVAKFKASIFYRPLVYGEWPHANMAKAATPPKSSVPVDKAATPTAKPGAHAATNPVANANVSGNTSTNANTNASNKSANASPNVSPNTSSNPLANPFANPPGSKSTNSSNTNTNTLSNTSYSNTNSNKSSNSSSSNTNYNSSSNSSAKAFTDIINNLKTQGAFKPASAFQLDREQGYGEKAHIINKIFGDKDNRLSMKTGDMRGDSMIDHIFNSNLLRAIRPFGRVLSHIDVVKNAQNFMQGRWKQKITGETINRTVGHENKLSTLMKMYYNKAHSTGYMKTKEWKEAQGDVDKMLQVQLAWEDKYLKKIIEVNRKLIERRGLLNQMNAYKDDVTAETNQAKVGFYRSVTARLIEGAIAALFSQFSSGYMEMRRRGQAGIQAAGNVPTAFGSQVSLLKQGVFATNQDVAKNIGELGNRFGTVNIPPQLAQQATYLTEHIKLSVEQAGRLNNMFYRMSSFSTKTATAMSNVAINMAYKNAYPVGTLMRDIADDADAFARHAAQGIQEFAKGEMLTRRMGTNLKSMEGFADRLVGDFDGSLRMQAEIQTYMPDMDFSKIMFASQFGSTADVTEALREQLKGRDISKMPRSFQLAIQKNLGLSFEEIQGLSRGTNQKPIEKGVDTTLHVDKALATSVMDFISANTKVILGLGLLTIASNSASAALFRMSLLGAITGKFGGAAGAVGATSGFSVGANSLLGTAALGTGAYMGFNQYQKAKESGHSTTASVGQGVATSGAAALVGLGGRAAGRWLFSKMAGKAIGAGIGGLLGSVLPGAGTVAGAVIGGIAADWLIDKMFNKEDDKTDAAVMHTGGVVGSPSTTKLIPSLAFAGAPKYHHGLMPDEFPTILQKGEAVLTNRHQQNIVNILNTVSASAAMSRSQGNVNNALNQAAKSRLSQPSIQMGSRNMETLTPQIIDPQQNTFSDRHTAIITNLASEATRANDDLSVPTPQAVASKTEPATAVSVDTSNVESLLRQMVSLLKQGQTINMDGKKVGNTILNAYNRE
jgi:hypothetical protein